MDKRLNDQWAQGTANINGVPMGGRLESLENILYRGDWHEGVSAFAAILEEVDPWVAETDFNKLVNAAILLNNWVPEDRLAAYENMNMQLSLCQYVGEVSRFYMFHQLPETRLEEGGFLRMARGGAQKTVLQAIEGLKQATAKDPNLMDRMMEAVTFLERTKKQPETLLHGIMPQESHASPAADL